MKSMKIAAFPHHNKLRKMLFIALVAICSFRWEGSKIRMLKNSQVQSSAKIKKLRSTYSEYGEDPDPGVINEPITSIPSSPSHLFCPRCCIWKNRITCEEAYQSTKQTNFTIWKILQETQKASKIKSNPCMIRHVHFEHTKGSRSNHPPRGQDGKWVQDMSYARRNTYIDRAQYENWGIFKYMQNYTKDVSLRFNSTTYKWVDANSPVTEISHDGFCSVCSRLGITKILVVGDSMSRGFCRSIEALLGYTYPEISKHGKLAQKLETGELEIPCDQSGEVSGVTIKYIKIFGLKDIEEVVADGTPEFVATNPNRTALVFNTGAHMKFIEQYREGFDLLLSWIDSWKVDRSDLLAFFRETLPGHPGCGSQKDVLGEKYDTSRRHKMFELQQRDESKPYGNYSEYLASTRYLLKSKRCWNPYDIKHMNGTIETYNSYSKSVFDERKGGDKLQVHWLNVYNSTILRRDGHLNFGGECILPSHLVFVASILILQTNDFLMFMSKCATW